MASSRVQLIDTEPGFHPKAIIQPEFIYLPISKCANSSLKAVIKMKRDGLQTIAELPKRKFGSKKNFYIHNDLWYDWIDITALSEYDGSPPESIEKTRPVFTCIRNPIQRVFSVYTQKYIEQKELDFFDRFFGIKSVNLSVERFIHKVILTSKNQHWDSYASYILGNEELLDHVVPMEFISDFWNTRFAEPFGYVELPKINSSKSNKYTLESLSFSTQRALLRKYKYDILLYNQLLEKYTKLGHDAFYQSDKTTTNRVRTKYTK